MPSLAPSITTQPSNALRFVERSGIRILQQAWLSLDGAITWRDVPLEKEITPADEKAIQQYREFNMAAQGIVPPKGQVTQDAVTHRMTGAKQNPGAGNG